MAALLRLGGFGRSRPVLDQYSDLWIRDEGALMAHRLGHIGGGEEEVASPQECLCSWPVDHGTAIDLARHREGDAGGDIGLDQSGDHVH